MWKLKKLQASWKYCNSYLASSSSSLGRPWRRELTLRNQLGVGSSGRCFVNLPRRLVFHPEYILARSWRDQTGLSHSWSAATFTTSFTTLNKKFKNKPHAIGVLPCLSRCSIHRMRGKEYGASTRSASLSPYCVILIALFLIGLFFFPATLTSKFHKYFRIHSRFTV